MSLFIELIEKRVNEINEKTGINPFDPLYCYCNHLKYLTVGAKTNQIKNKIVSATKMLDLYNTLNKKFFMNDKNCEYLLDEICKIQKIYNSFSRLLFIYKFKKAKVAITTDLYLNELTPEMKNVVVIYQNNTKYYFTVRDLINIVSKKLSNNEYFFPKPLIIKNPYNNIIFSICQLYNIYFAIKESSYMMPELFQGYFKCNFSLRLFCINYETNIRNISIKNYVYNSHFEILYPIIFTMCEHYNKRMYDEIHEDFPKEKLVKIMRPYLYLYFIVNYGLEGTMNIDYSYITLKYKLMLFETYNKNFGRKIVKTKTLKNGKCALEVTFNDDHIHFY